MPDTTATILIPDISGFTEFMTSTELSHGTFAINMLIDAIIAAVGEEYEVSEIEGDAVLLIRKGPAPARKDVEDICLKIFNSFHFRRKWMQMHAVCPCGACLAIDRLALKFVVHHGPVAEIKVGKFVKQSGTEMIVAHRLLKNGIDNHEYLLVTNKLHGDQTDDSGSEMTWTTSSAEYPAIGKVDFRFALLSEERKKCPVPPSPPDYFSDDTPYTEIAINAGFRDVYMVMMNIPGRPAWLHGLQKVEQDIPQVFVGSVHLCTFENFVATVSPLRMRLMNDQILYAESCYIADLDLTFIHEYLFSGIDDHHSVFSWRIMHDGSVPVPVNILALLQDRMRLVAENLAAHCANMEGNVFHPAFQH